MQTVPPHLSWTAYRLRTKGVLTVGDDQALFQSSSGDLILIKKVMKVTKGWKDSVNGVWLPWVVNTYIEIVFGDPANPSVVFVNDSRWFGLATYLPHRSLVRSLQALIPTHGSAV